MARMSLFDKRSAGSSLGELLNHPRPSAWQQFLSQPCVYLVRQLYTSSWVPMIPAQPLSNPVSVVCVSDTHNCQPVLPDGDILIHTGDLTQSGSYGELQATVDWLLAQPHATKIVIAGNHDLFLDTSYSRRGSGTTAATTATATTSGNNAEDRTVHWGDIIYLQNTETTVTCANGRRLRVYGSPYSPRHGNWAFQYPRSENVWNGQVPDGTDILITHGPPRSHLDLLHLGCVHLLRELWRVRPRLHVFGHVHEGAGTEWLQFDALQDLYERVVVARGGVWGLARVTWGVVKMVVFCCCCCRRRLSEAKCLLVNPAIVGGLRDQEQRQPVRVTI